MAFDIYDNYYPDEEPGGMDYYNSPQFSVYDQFNADTSAGDTQTLDRTVMDQFNYDTSGQIADDTGGGEPAGWGDTTGIMDQWNADTSGGGATSGDAQVMDLWNYGTSDAGAVDRATSQWNSDTGGTYTDQYGDVYDMYGKYLGNDWSVTGSKTSPDGSMLDYFSSAPVPTRSNSPSPSASGGGSSSPGTSTGSMKLETKRMRVGNDLVIYYSDGTSVTQKNYFGQTAVSLGGATALPGVTKTNPQSGVSTGNPILDSFLQGVLGSSTSTRNTGSTIGTGASAGSGYGGFLPSGITSIPSARTPTTPQPTQPGSGTTPLLIGGALLLAALASGHN